MDESKLPVDLLNLISPILQEELSTSDLILLQSQLTSLEQYRYRIAHARWELYSDLLRQRMRVLLPKSKDFTELDRKTNQQGALHVLEADFEFLCQVETIIAERLELGMTLLQTI